MLVVRDLYLGKSLFREFQQSPERIASNVLTERLNRLTHAGLVERFPAPHKADAHGYRMSEKGRTLIPVLEAIAAWGDANLEGCYFGLGKGPKPGPS